MNCVYYPCGNCNGFSGLNSDYCEFCNKYEEKSDDEEEEWDMNEEELNQLAFALDNVSLLSGVVAIEDDLCIKIGYYDNYLIAYVLSEMIKDGSCKIKLNGEKNDYFRMLLKENHNYNDRANVSKESQASD